MKKIGVFILVAVMMLSLTSCVELSDPGVHYISAKSDVKELTDSTIDKIVNNVIANMTLDEKVGQMFIVDLSKLESSKKSVKKAKLTKRFVKSMDMYPVGGVVFFSWDVKTREQVSSFIDAMQENSEYPMFIAVDEEGGRVSRVGSNSKMKVTYLPSMATIGTSGDAKVCKRMYKKLGKDLKKLGFNLDFAPVADIYSDSVGVDATYAEIGDRSFGSDSKLCARMVSSAVKGLNSSGMCATIKHFPGMRGASSDTHLTAANVGSDIAELRQYDFKPFKSGIKAGADFCMLSHEAVNSVTGDTTPSTMSSLVIKDILRGELGFDGIVISDAMNMKPITERYSSDEAAVLSIKAGVDIVLMPDDLEEAYDGVIKAVKDGKISEKRINSSVRRIIKCKLLKGIIKLDSKLVIDAGADSYKDIGQMEND